MRWKKIKKTIKKEGLSPKFRTLSKIEKNHYRRKNKISTIKNKRFKLNNSKLLKLERIILNKFVNLSKDEVKKIFLSMNQM